MRIAPLPSRRLGVLPLLAMLAAALLGGCVGLHADPRITPGLDVSSSGAPQVVYLPPGPQTESSAEAVVRGFLRAASYPGEGAAVAKSYLTPALAARWNPEAEILVFDGVDQPALSARGPERFVLSGTPRSRLSAEGRLEILPDAERRSATVEMTRLDGQWRIAQLPPDFGRWVTTASFGQLTRQVQVEYVASAQDVLIPDVRYVLADRLATRVTRLQFGSVPDYLAGAVRSETSRGLRLLLDAVPVVDGVARVDLAATSVSNDPVVRRLIYGQLAAALTRLPGVDSVAITVEGAPLDVPGVSGPVASAADLGFTQAPPRGGVLPLLRAGTALHPFDPTQIRKPDALNALVEQRSAYPAVDTAFERLALDYAGTEVAGVAQGELARFRATESGSTPNFGSALTGAAYDPEGFLWVAGQGNDARRSGRIWVVDANAWPATDEAARARPLGASWLADRRPVSLSVSEDGLRLAVISTASDRSDSRLEILGIIRDGTGTPTGLTRGRLRLGPELRALRDVTWTGVSAVVVLAARGKDALRPQVIDLGQDVLALAPVPQASSISTFDGTRSLLVTAAGQTWLRAGGSWLPIPVGSEVVVPGQ